MNDPNTKKRAKKVRRLRLAPKPETSLDIDVRPSDLLHAEDAPGLGPILREVDQQWPQGRGASGSRIGTVEVYFDDADILHMHFRARGAYLLREDALEHVPVGHLSGYSINPVFNVADTRAEKVGDLLVSLPSGVDPNDPRWRKIADLLAEMHKG